MSTSMVVPCTVVVAAKSSSGSMVVALTSETLPRVKSSRWPSRLKSPRRKVRSPSTAGADGIAGHGELAADLGIEAAAAHEHRLRRLHVQRQPHAVVGRLLGPTGVGGGGGGAVAGTGLAGAVDLLHRDGRIAGGLRGGDRQLGAVDGDRAGDVEAVQRRAGDLDVARDARDQVGPADQQRPLGVDREIDREALRRIEPHRAGHVDRAVARGLEAQALDLQRVALQRRSAPRRR